MENLPKDVRELISKELSIRDFLNYCGSSKKMCSDDGIWRRRARNDYGDMIDYAEGNTYKEKYLFITKTIFNFIDKEFWKAFVELFGKAFIDVAGKHFENVIKSNFLEYILETLNGKISLKQLEYTLYTDINKRNIKYLKYLPLFFDDTDLGDVHIYIVNLAIKLNMINDESDSENSEKDPYYTDDDE